MIGLDIHTYGALRRTHAYRPSYFPFRVRHYTGSIEKLETKVGVKYLEINMYIFEVVSIESIVIVRSYYLIS